MEQKKNYYEKKLKFNLKSLRNYDKLERICEHAFYENMNVVFDESLFCVNFQFESLLRNSKNILCDFKETNLRNFLGRKFKNNDALRNMLSRLQIINKILDKGWKNKNSGCYLNYVKNTTLTQSSSLVANKNVQYLINRIEDKKLHIELLWSTVNCIRNLKTELHRIIILLFSIQNIQSIIIALKKTHDIEFINQKENTNMNQINTTKKSQSLRNYVRTKEYQFSDSFNFKKKYDTRQTLGFCNKKISEHYLAKDKDLSLIYYPIYSTEKSYYLYEKYWENKIPYAISLSNKCPVASNHMLCHEILKLWRDNNRWHGRACGMPPSWACYPGFLNESLAEIHKSKFLRTDIKEVSIYDCQRKLIFCLDGIKEQSIHGSWRLPITVDPGNFLAQENDIHDNESCNCCTSEEIEPNDAEEIFKSRNEEYESESDIEDRICNDDFLVDDGYLSNEEKNQSQNINEGHSLIDGIQKHEKTLLEDSSFSKNYNFVLDKFRSELQAKVDRAKKENMVVIMVNLEISTFYQVYANQLIPFHFEVESTQTRTEITKEKEYFIVTLTKNISENIIEGQLIARNNQNDLKFIPNLQFINLFEILIKRSKLQIINICKILNESYPNIKISSVRNMIMKVGRWLNRRKGWLIGDIGFHVVDHTKYTKEIITILIDLNKVSCGNVSINKVALSTKCHLGYFSVKTFLHHEKSNVMKSLQSKLNRNDKKSQHNENKRQILLNKAFYLCAFFRKISSKEILLKKHVKSSSKCLMIAKKNYPKSVLYFAEKFSLLDIFQSYTMTNYKTKYLAGKNNCLCNLMLESCVISLGEITSLFEYTTN
jgi:hypothetical protein